MHHTLYLQEGDLDPWGLHMCSLRHLPTGFQGVTVPSQAKQQWQYLAGIQLISGPALLLLQKIPPVIKGVTLVFTQCLQPPGRP